MFSVGEGISSVDVWFFHIEEVLGLSRFGELNVFVADVGKSFDANDRDILDCRLGRAGLPTLFRKVYFASQRS